MELQDDMPLTEALAYVLEQYDVPEWLKKAVINLSGGWQRLQAGPNYGKEDHPEGWPEDEYCVCNECLRSA